jgi:hypothetical protein
MEQKIFRAPLELKADGEAGEFTAVFATFNVIDHHGDVTEPGAFPDGAEAIVEPWNHGWDLPAGKGVIQSDGEKVWLDGRFFLSTSVGKDTYETVKELGGLAEWSYSFDIEESGQGEHHGQQVRFLRKLDVVGVGPVTRGAGIGTRTEMIKQKPSSSGGDEGEGGGEDSAVKPSGPDADLLTEIQITEIGLTAQGVISHEKE